MILSIEEVFTITLQKYQRRPGLNLKFSYFNSFDLPGEHGSDLYGLSGDSDGVYCPALTVHLVPGLMVLVFKSIFVRQRGSDQDHGADVHDEFKSLNFYVRFNIAVRISKPYRTVHVTCT